MRQEIIDKVRAAGVVGAGGAGFPTHVKLSAEVETVLANGASCEPLLMSDPYLMEHETGNILRGLQAVMDCTGAATGSVCLKGKHVRAMAAMKEAVSRNGSRNLSVFELGDFYPAGDEQVLVYEALGRVVPEGGLPLQVGVMVCNVETLLNIAQALDGRPVTERYLTVTGEVARPGLVKVPLGMSAAEVIDAAGGAAVSEFKVVLGGPMMGLAADDPNVPVTKTTSGIIVLPPEHNVVAGKIKDPRRILYLTRVACCQCSRCTDLCPRSLLGHSLQPHKIMRQLGSPLGSAAEVMQDALICSECGVCEKFACPMMISPREVNAQIKRRLLGEGAKRTPKKEEYRPSAFRRLRRVPTDRLVQRLQVAKYEGHPEFRPLDRPPSRVTVPLKQHLGAPARPVVKPGDLVKVGELIGEIPEKALGARVHASIEGRVQAVTEAAVTIEG